MKKETTDLEERLIEFASRIIELVETLPQKPTAKHMGGQLMRSGTSPAHPSNFKPQKLQKSDIIYHQSYIKNSNFEFFLIYD